jgi:hypothetical protein
MSYHTTQPLPIVPPQTNGDEAPKGAVEVGGVYVAAKTLNVIGQYNFYRHQVQHPSFAGYLRWQQAQRALRQAQPRHSVPGGWICLGLAALCAGLTVVGPAVITLWACIICLVLSGIFFSRRPPSPEQVAEVDAEVTERQYPPVTANMSQLLRRLQDEQDDGGN